MWLYVGPLVAPRLAPWVGIAGASAGGVRGEAGLRRPGWSGFRSLPGTWRQGRRARGRGS